MEVMVMVLVLVLVLVMVLGACWVLAGCLVHSL